MAYKYKKRSKPKGRVLRPQSFSREADEGLTGYIRGIPAGSADEERFARAFDKYKIGFEYQVPIYTMTTLPGKPKKVDFVLKNKQPFEGRGFIGHYRTLGQQSEDRVRELELNRVFRKIGLLPLKWAKFTEYGETQETVDLYVRRNLL